MKAYELAAENKGMREEIERLRHDIERHIAIARRPTPEITGAAKRLPVD